MQNQTINEVNVTKKPFYKKWWFWLIIILIVLGAIGSAQDKKESNNVPSDSKSVVNQNKSKVDTKKKKVETTVTTVPKTTKNPKQVEKEYKVSCKTINYKTLSRNPDKYKGNRYKFKGKVVQVMDSDSWFDDSTTLRIDVTATKNEFADGGYLWSDTIVASVVIPEGADRILEDDIITFWGDCDGLYSYKSVLGQKISLPKIDIKYFSIK